MKTMPWAAPLVVALTLLVVLGGGVPLYGVPVKLDDPRNKPEQTVTIESQLSKDDPLDRVQMLPAKIHPMTMRKGHLYLIDMVSADFDSFLRIETMAGKELAQDDDSGGNLNARIRFVAPEDGTFKIIATAFAFANGPGKYSLRVQPLGLPDARGAGKSDKKIHEVARAGLTLEGGLDKNDDKDTVRQNSPCKVYQVRLAGGKTYRIDLESKDFDTYLRLENSEGQQLARDDDGGEGTNSRLSFQAPGDGVYRFIATTFNAGEGNFRLSVREEVK
jgi:hypothetical protein